MTKTQLEELALKTYANYKEFTASPRHFGRIYTSDYCNSRIHVYMSDAGILYAVFHKGVCYLMRPTQYKPATCDIQELSFALGTPTQVFLYSNPSNWLYRDELGYHKGNITHSISEACDYADVIPIPAL